MVIPYVRTNPYPSTIGTTRTLTIATAPATQIVSLSGYMGWQIVCLGPGAIAYGDSSIAMATAGLLFYSMSRTEHPIADTASLYVRADSVATVIAINDLL